MSSSGKGQSRLTSADDVAPAWDKALTAGRVKEARVIVEGEIKFDFEITQLTVRAADGTHFCEPIGHRPGRRRLCRILAAPGDDSAGAGTCARHGRQGHRARWAGRAFSASNCSCKGDEVWFSEVSPRPHDTGLVTLVSQYQSEFALHARAILGLPVSTALTAPGASAVIYGGMDAKGIAFDGVDEALERSGKRIAPVRQAGILRQTPHGRGAGARRDTNEARARAKQAAALVKPVKS